ncbi:MAG TPA: hypothetical protein DF699_16110, partial [Phycisphaerales bacterium]|nr:hypothetical protein [Phycisphaerales bacterium]
RGAQRNPIDNVDPALQPIQDKRRIKVTAQFEIPLGDADVFLLDQVEPVLRNQMQRDGAPYTIVMSQAEPWTDSSATTGRGTSRPRPGGQTGRIIDDRQSTGRTSTNIDSLAPIINPDDVRDRSSSGSDEPASTTVTITWYAVIDPMDDTTNANNGDQP